MIVLALALSGVLLVGAVSYARAHSVLLDDGSSFTFDPYCCNKNDCAEVPLSAITAQGDGWAVDYISPKTGRRIRGFIREGATGHKWSPNHQVFACETAIMNKDGSYFPRCVYPQKPGL